MNCHVVMCVSFLTVPVASATILLGTGITTVTNAYPSKLVPADELGKLDLESR